MMTLDHYTAAKNAAAVIKEDWMGVIKLTGPDRHAWLQGMVTNDVVKLKPGEGCYAGHLNAQGKLLAQMIVLAADEAIWLLVERNATEKLAATFDRLIIMEDAQVQDVSNDYDVLGIVGPRAAQSFGSFAAAPAGGLYRHEELEGGRILKSDLGFEWIVPRAVSTETLEKIVSAGATSIDADVWNVLRIESGLPLYGTDIDETTVLPELGQRGISYDKGCYIGQEVVAKIKYIGHVNRRFAGFLCEGETVPEVRSAVRVNGKESGYVTSSVFSPGAGKALALGFVSRIASEPGTAVELAGGKASIAARVHALPFPGSIRFLG
jgi:folate-binding protein YgfZ